MKKTKKKGFTLVELLVVIAILAILATVSILGYTSFTKKANESVDEQAVTQMNLVLQANEVLAGKTITDVYEALEAAGLTAENYKPLYTGRYFFWDQKTNRIVYTDENYNVLFPNEVTSDKANWFTLSGKVKQEAVTISNTGTASAKSAEELYYLLETGKASVKEITLTEDINMMGADISFDNISLVAPEGKIITISNLCQTSSHSISSNKEAYRSGFISLYDSKVNTEKTVTIKNIKFENSVIGSLETGNVGGLVGRITGVELTIENVEFVNCSIYARQKGGLFVGYADTNSKVTINNCKVTNCSVTTVEAEGGKLIGAMQNSELVYDNSVDLNQITLNVVDGVDVTGSTLDYAEESAKTNVVIEKLAHADGEYATSSLYRAFNSNAITSVVNKASAKINDKTYKAQDITTLKIDGKSLKGCTPIVPFAN